MSPQGSGSLVVVVGGAQGSGYELSIKDGDTLRCPHNYVEGFGVGENICYEAGFEMAKKWSHIGTSVA